MDANAKSRAKLEAARQAALAAASSRSDSATLPQPSTASSPKSHGPAGNTVTSAPTADIPARPVRSAKDAINAMYAQDSNKRLSNYLATSAKEIINSAGLTGDNKTAASLHQHATKRRIEMARPSASGLFRAAAGEEPVIPSDTTSAMDPLAHKTAPARQPRIIKPREEQSTPPVIKTSLKLGPKKTPTILNAEAKARTARRKGLNGQKGQTALAELLASRSASVKTVAHNSPRPIDDITSPAATTPVDAHTAEALRIMRQSVKKATGAPLDDPSSTKPQFKKRTSRGIMQDIIRPAKPYNTTTKTTSRTASKQTPPRTTNGLPSDSVKHRFEAAPKGYTAAPQTISNDYIGFNDTATSKPPVEIYGLMDEEPTGKRPDTPIVEDYQPKDTAKSSSTDAKTPDGNKYSIQGQSPFFLKSVTVEKRPLSGSIGTKPTTTSPEGTLYQRPASTPIGTKNVYDRQEAKKSLPTKPTVIIPASRRSKAPLIFLMILTVLLGGAVGAFVYLCFFQYME